MPEGLDTQPLVFTGQEWNEIVPDKMPHRFH